MRCQVHGCCSKAAIKVETSLKGKTLHLSVCKSHHALLVRLQEDVREEKALKREQAAERRRWADPQFATR